MELDEQSLAWRAGVEAGIPRVGAVPRHARMTNLDKMWWQYAAINVWPTDAYLRYLTRNGLSSTDGGDEDGDVVDAAVCTDAPPSLDQVRKDIRQYAPVMGWSGPGSQGNYTHYDSCRCGPDFYEDKMTVVSEGLVVNTCGIRHWAFGSDGKIFLNDASSSSFEEQEFLNADYVQLARNVRVVAAKNLTPSALALCARASMLPEKTLDRDGVYVTVDGTQIWNFVADKMRKAQDKVGCQSALGGWGAKAGDAYNVQVIEIVPKNVKPFGVAEEERELYSYSFSPKELQGISYTEQAKVAASRKISSVETLTALLSSVQRAGGKHPTMGMRDVARRDFYSKKKTTTVRRAGFKNKKGTKMMSRLGQKTEGLERAVLARLVARGLPEGMDLLNDPLFAAAVSEGVTSFPDVCPGKLEPDEWTGIKPEIGSILQTSGNCRTSKRGMGALKSQTITNTHDFLDKIYECPILQATLRFLERRCPGFMTFAELINTYGLTSCKGDVLRTIYVLMCYIYYVRTMNTVGEDGVNFSRTGQKKLAGNLRDVMYNADIRTRYINEVTDETEVVKFDMDHESGIPLKVADGAEPFGSKVETLMLPEEVVRLVGREGVALLTGHETGEVEGLTRERGDDKDFRKLLGEADLGLETLISYVTGTRFAGFVSASDEGAIASIDMVVDAPKMLGWKEGEGNRSGGVSHSGGSNILKDTKGQVIDRKVVEADRDAAKALARSQKVRQAALKNLDDVRRAGVKSGLAPSQKKVMEGTRRSLRAKKSPAVIDSSIVESGGVESTGDALSDEGAGFETNRSRRKRARAISISDEDDDDEVPGGLTENEKSGEAGQGKTQAAANNCPPVPGPTKRQRILAATLAACTPLKSGESDNVNFTAKAVEIGGKPDSDQGIQKAAKSLSDKQESVSPMRSKGDGYGDDVIEDYEALPRVPRLKTQQFGDNDDEDIGNVGSLQINESPPGVEDAVGQDGNPNPDEIADHVESAGGGRYSRNEEGQFAVPTPRGSLNVLAESAIQAAQRDAENADMQTPPKAPSPPGDRSNPRSESRTGVLSGAATEDDTPMHSSIANVDAKNSELAVIGDTAEESEAEMDSCSPAVADPTSGRGEDQNEEIESGSPAKPAVGSADSKENEPSCEKVDLEPDAVLDLHRKMSLSLNAHFSVPEPVNAPAISDEVLNDDRAVAKVFVENVKRSVLFQKLFGGINGDMQERRFVLGVGGCVRGVLEDGRPRAMQIGSQGNGSGPDNDEESILKDSGFHRALGLRYGPILAVVVSVMHYLEQRCWRDHIRGRKGRLHYGPGWFEKKYKDKESRDEYAISYVRVLRDFLTPRQDNQGSRNQDYTPASYGLGPDKSSVRGVGLSVKERRPIVEHAAVLYEETFREYEDGNFSHESNFTISVPRSVGQEANFPWLEKESDKQVSYPGKQKFSIGCARFTKVTVRGRRMFVSLHDLVCTTRWEAGLRVSGLESPARIGHDVMFGELIWNENAEICILEMHPSVPGAWTTPADNVWDYDSHLMKEIISRAQGMSAEEEIHARSSSVVVQFFLQRCLASLGALSPSRVVGSATETQQGRLMVNIMPQSVSICYRRLFCKRTREPATMSIANDGDESDHFQSAGKIRMSLPLGIGLSSSDLQYSWIVDPELSTVATVDEHVLISAVDHGCYGVHFSPVLSAEGLYDRREREEVPARGGAVLKVREPDSLMPLVHIVSSLARPHREYGTPLPIWESDRTLEGIESDCGGDSILCGSSLSERRSCMNWRLAVATICPRIFWDLEWGS